MDESGEDYLYWFQQMYAPTYRWFESDGGIYALKHFQEVTLDGEMPDGRPNKVKILVATPPAMLVMKGYALANRDKMKDAYLEGSPDKCGDMTLEQIQNDAYFSVNEWVFGKGEKANLSKVERNHLASFTSLLSKNYGVPDE